MITGSTQVIGIIGDPVAHSLSPAIHNAAFAALGLDMVYVALPVRGPDVGAAVEGLAALGFRGANVTVPHKGAVLPYLSWLDDDARLAQAVNTIVVEGGALRGYNTDVQGAHAALVAACGDTLRGAPALLLGAGGAARAVALALARLGARLTVVNRSGDAAERLAALVTAAVPAAACRWLPLSELTAAEVMAQRLIVNGTPLGMPGAGKVPALLVDRVSEGQIVFDVVYGHAETDLLRQARRRGATTVDGLAMLVGQAAAAFEIWTGLPAPLDIMCEALIG
jgi:shikimate dehydrogenase